MSYVPERGDVVWLNFTPQSGGEQMGTRPALILSPKKYNQKTGLAIYCPITSQKKGYPFEVSVRGKKVDGVILSDHLKNLDWRARKVKFIERAHPQAIEETSEKIALLLSLG